MMDKGVTCEHLNKLAHVLENELWQSKESLRCFDCGCPGPNLWICLQPDCHHIGCSEVKNDHSTLHQKSLPSHCVHMNVSTERLWCYACQKEVHIKTAIAYAQMVAESAAMGGSSGVPTLGLDHSVGLNVSLADEDDDDLDEDDATRPRGIVGLQNMGNTCYMNAALQALSNTTPLTSYFLECAPAIALLTQDKKPGLARAYLKLIKEMWDRKTRGYVVPSGILYGIRNVHPQFRGYHQHDTQEFLRCFMDQLHEELKEPVYDGNTAQNKVSSTAEGDHSERRNPQFRRRAASSASDAPLFARVRRKSPAPSTYSESRAEGYNRVHTMSEGGTYRRHRRSASYAGTNYQNDFAQCRFYTGSVSGTARRGTSGTASGSDSCASSGDERYETASSGASDTNTQAEGGAEGTAGAGAGDTGAAGTRYRSIISDVFDGQLLSSVQCLVCNRVSTRVETFQDLSLPIPSRDHLAVIRSQPIMNAPAMAQQDSWIWWVLGWLRSWIYGPVVSLQDCLAAFFSADELKGDNMYSCTRCNKLRNGIKISSVTRLPEVLCVHLKRFRHELMFSAKVAQRVAFPLRELDMAPYAHADCVSRVRRYTLSSVIVHCGTAGGGHYTCVARRGARCYTLDDHVAAALPSHHAANVEAYVLFYKKVNPEMDVLRQKANEILDASAGEASEVTYYISKQWINKFLTWAEPGPVDNWSFSCLHGAARPPAPRPALAAPIAPKLWDFFYTHFGGGPICTSLRECAVCGAEWADSAPRPLGASGLADLAARRHQERLAFAKIHTDTQDRDNEHRVTYAIGLPWLRLWQAFVRSTGPTPPPPPPIDNESLLATQDVDGVPTYVLKPNADYAQLNEDLWRFFHDNYGGGPEIKLQPTPYPPTTNHNHTEPYKSSSETNIRASSTELVRNQNQSLQNLNRSVKRSNAGSDNEVNYRQFYKKTETNGNHSETDEDMDVSYDNRYKTHNGNDANDNNIYNNKVASSDIELPNLDSISLKSKPKQGKVRKNKRRTVK